jgi:DNA adenine methylase
LSTSRPSHEDRTFDECRSAPSGPDAGVRPFLKWPGGKRWLAPLVTELVGPDLKRAYYEPFLGGGAVFLHLNPRSAVLSDVNIDLIESLDVIRNHPRDVVKATWRYSNTKECFERVRRSVPRTQIGTAARFLYLNRTCWGGIYRLNRKGEFNTPFGNSGRAICSQREILEASARFKGAVLKACDFDRALASCGDGDVAYLDPPYAAPVNGDCFVRYNRMPFTWADHVRLASAASLLARRGALVVLSAFWRDELLSMYEGWWAVQLVRHSNVSRSARDRRKITEVLIFNRVPLGFAGANGGRVRSLRRLSERDRSYLRRTFLAG